MSEEGEWGLTRGKLLGNRPDFDIDKWRKKYQETERKIKEGGVVVLRGTSSTGKTEILQGLKNKSELRVVSWDWQLYGYLLEDFEREGRELFWSAVAFELGLEQEVKGEEDFWGEIDRLKQETEASDQRLVFLFDEVQILPSKGCDKAVAWQKKWIEGLHKRGIGAVEVLVEMGEGRNLEDFYANLDNVLVLDMNECLRQ
ncbi:hypothetical protein KJ909_02225 [Patescibacteria group bacterium]|nr:hypothetical protein [Patescibacteria group bacterium]